MVLRKREDLEETTEKKGACTSIFDGEARMKSELIRKLILDVKKHHLSKDFAYDPAINFPEWS